MSNIPGLDLEGLSKIKWGPGVFGRTTILTAIAMLCTAAVAIIASDHSLERSILVLSVPAEFLTSLIFGYIFSLLHPSLSVLEGGEATVYKQAEIAAKGVVIDQLPNEKMKMVTPTVFGGTRDD